MANIMTYHRLYWLFVSPFLIIIVYWINFQLIIYVFLIFFTSSCVICDPVALRRNIHDAVLNGRKKLNHKKDMGQISVCQSLRRHTVMFTSHWPETIWITARQNQQNDLCTQRRLRSVWASAHYEDSDQTLRMSRICLYWAHRSFCWLCHTAAHF